MEDITCEVCCLDFNDNDIIPKVLDCGHSLCSPCISKLIKTNPSCPKCRNNMSKDVESYPTNYSLLGITAAHKKYKFMECHLECRLQLIKNRFLAQRESLSKKKNQLCSNLEIVKNGIARIQQLLDTDKDELNLREANETLENLEAEYKTIQNVFVLNYWKMRMNVTISLTNFESPNHYLDEIYGLLLEGGDALYSIEKVDDTIKYGKISIQNNMIIVHAICLSELPENASTVWFADLKKSISSKDKFRAFFNLSCNAKGVTHKVLIELKDSQLVPQFIRLCTGETGPSYKGCKYSNKGQNSNNYLNKFVYVEKYLENGVEKSGSVDYGMNSDTTVSFQTNDLVVTGSSDGKFQISSSTHSTNHSSVIGKVVSPLNLKDLIVFGDSEYLKILDSGFVFQF